MSSEEKGRRLVADRVPVLHGSMSNVSQTRLVLLASSELELVDQWRKGHCLKGKEDTGPEEQRLGKRRGRASS